MSVQALNTRHGRAEGRVLVGRKVGLTAKAVQQQIGVSQPDFGAPFADMRIADGGVLNPVRALQPKAEAEIALTMRSGLDDPAPPLDPAIAAIATPARPAPHPPQPPPLPPPPPP